LFFFFFFLGSNERFDFVDNIFTEAQLHYAIDSILLRLYPHPVAGWPCAGRTLSWRNLLGGR